MANFWQNPWTNPYGKMKKKFHFLNAIFLLCRKANFLSRTLWKTFYGPN